GPLTSAPAGTETLLVAEDDDGIRRLARVVLTSLGYRVLEARDGEDALAVARKQAGTIDLLVTDVVMPRLGGRDLAERLRLLRPAVKILYLSGYSDEALGPRGIPDGMGFLQKPFTPLALARRVR